MPKTKLLITSSYKKLTENNVAPLLSVFEGPIPSFLSSQIGPGYGMIEKSTGF
jgi:hypothetical protein